MSLPQPLAKIFGHIDKHKNEYIKNLEEVIAIQSVSACPEKRAEVNKMAEWVANRLKRIGVTVELRPIGQQTLSDGSKLDLPPVVLGKLGNDPTKKTVCLYGHLDVQPALKEDGWHTDPFVLTEIDGKLFGRGSSDDKGPVLGWLHVLEAYKSVNEPIPVNIRFIFESMEESGSKGMPELLLAEKNGFLKGVDYVCVSDSYWMVMDKPNLVYGLRGLCYFFVEIECAGRDLHSGIFGGSVYEGMTDLIWLLNSLVDKKGKILIPHIYDEVAPVQENEHSIYDKVRFNVNEFKSNIGCKKLAHNEDKKQLLMHRWRFPSLSIHGIEGAFSEPGQKTVIPGKVIGKFSIRTVANQRSQSVEKCVVDYLNQLWQDRGSPNSMKAFMNTASDPWVEDPYDPNFQAGARATKHVYNVEPDLTREGSSIPVTLMLQETTGKNVLLLPVGLPDDRSHSQNEKLNVETYIEGTKLLGAYLYEVSKIK